MQVLSSFLQRTHSCSHTYMSTLRHWDYIWKINEIKFKYIYKHKHAPFIDENRLKKLTHYIAIRPSNNVCLCVLFRCWLFDKQTFMWFSSFRSYKSVVCHQQELEEKESVNKARAAAATDKNCMLFVRNIEASNRNIVPYNNNHK